MAPPNAYYIYDNVIYATQFPSNWAKNHKMNTGPHNCAKCRAHGFWNGVFVCYCLSCANMYDYKRGGGVHIGGLSNGEYGVYRPSVKAAYNSYLFSIPLDDIGDKSIFDSARYWGVDGTKTLGDIIFQKMARPIKIGGDDETESNNSSFIS